MTKQETFKRRIRARMATTGERYAAARRALIEQAPAGRGREWVSEPELTDEAITAGTGRGWEEWCAVIDGWAGRTDGHAAIVRYLREEHGVEDWWRQSVTVGYERIVGIRLPHQHADGTFSASKSMTISMDGGELRELLLDSASRTDLFGGIQTELRSKPTSKSIRLGIGPGVALLSLRPKSNGRTTVAIEHQKLERFDDVAEWKFFWADWLRALDES